MGIKGFITPDHQYYEAEDAADSLDREVPIRPNAKLVWNGATWDRERRKLFVQALEDLEREDQERELDKTRKPDFTETPSVGRGRKKLGFSINRIHFGIKDLITIGYFVVSIAGLWLHMRDRIMVLEQKLSVAEKEIQGLQMETAENEKLVKDQLSNLEAQISEAQMLLMRKN